MRVLGARARAGALPGLQMRLWHLHGDDGDARGGVGKGRGGRPCRGRPEAEDGIYLAEG